VILLQEVLDRVPAGRHSRRPVVVRIPLNRLRHRLKPLFRQTRMIG